MLIGSLSAHSKQIDMDRPVLPGCCGFWSLGLTVGLLSLVEMQIWPFPLRLFRLLLLLGGGVMLLAGFYELRRKNDFGTMMNFGFGFFWLSLCGFFYVPLGPGRSENPALLACFVIMWGLFSCILFLGTLRQAYLTRTAVASLAIYQFAWGAALLKGQPELQVVAGGFGLASGMLFLVLGAVRLGRNR